MLSSLPLRLLPLRPFFDKNTIAWVLVTCLAVEALMNSYGVLEIAGRAKYIQIVNSIHTIFLPFSGPVKLLMMNTMNFTSR
jgi:hypothetical protein